MTRHVEALRAISEDDGCRQAEQRHRPGERKRGGTTRHRVRQRWAYAVAVPLRLELLEEAWFEEPEGPEDDRDDPADPIRHRLRGHSPGSPPWRKARIGVDGANGDRASGEKEDHARRQDHEPTYLHVGSLDGRGLVRSLAEHRANESNSTPRCLFPPPPLLSTSVQRPVARRSARGSNNVGSIGGSISSCVTPPTLPSSRGWCSPVRSAGSTPSHHRARSRVAPRWPSTGCGQRICSR